MTRMTTSKYAVLATLAGLFLTACTGQVTKDIEASVENSISTLESVEERWALEKASREVSSVENIRGLYLAPYLIKMQQGDPLPQDWLEGETDWIVPGQKTIFELANGLMVELGVPVQIFDQIPVQSIRGEQLSVMSVPGMENDRPLSGTSRANNNILDIINRRNIVNVHGTWKDKLDQIAALYKVKWVLEDGILKFKFFETNTFSLRHTAGAYTLKSSVTTDGGGSAGVSSNGEQSTELSATLDIWSKIEEGVKGIVPANSSIVSSPDTGTISVTTLAYRMPDVVRYIEEWNNKLSMQVTFSLDIYSLTLSDAEKAAFNMNIAFRDLRDRFGFDFRGIGSTFDGTSSLTGAILSPPAGSAFAEWSGTEVVAEVLKTGGKVVTEYSDKRFAKNYSPTAFQLTNQVSYIRERELVTDSLGGVKTSVRAGTVSSGYKLQLLPNIHPDGTVTLRIALSISQLESITSIGGTDNVIQTPNINVGDLLNELTVASGDMIMLSGFEQLTSRTEKESGGSVLCFTCKNNSADKERRKFFVVIRPHVLRAPQPVVLEGR